MKNPCFLNRLSVLTMQARKKTSEKKKRLRFARMRRTLLAARAAKAETITNA